MSLTAEQWSEEMLRRLTEKGYATIQATYEDGQTVRGVRRFDFRARWLLTGLHTVVVVHHAETVTADDLHELSRRSTRAALKAKGRLPRGFQTGVAVLPVVVCASARPDAVKAASAAPRIRFALQTVPILVELDRGRFITHHEPRIWGEVYEDFVGEQQALVGLGLQGRTLPSGGEHRAVRRTLVWGGVSAAVLVAVVLALPLLSLLGVI